MPFRILRWVLFELLFTALAAKIIRLSLVLRFSCSILRVDIHATNGVSLTICHDLFFSFVLFLLVLFPMLGNECVRPLFVI